MAVIMNTFLKVMGTSLISNLTVALQMNPVTASPPPPRMKDLLSQRTDKTNQEIL